MPEVQDARARKQQRGRDGVAPFMDAAVVVIPRRAGSFRGPGAEEGIPRPRRERPKRRDATPRARARSRRAPPALISARATQPRRP